MTGQSQSCSCRACRRIFVDRSTLGPDGQVTDLYFRTEASKVLTAILECLTSY
jgi:hypothetical protein